MGEAERSIAIKRRIIAPRQVDREDSPSEVYTPKRKKSSSGPEPSPPPYIPSRKENSSGSVKVSANSNKSQHEVDNRRGHSNSRSEHTRQTLSSQDRRDLISRSRRMELFKHIGIDRKEEPLRSSSGSHLRSARQSPKRTDSRKVAERDQQRLNPTNVSSREVSNKRRGGDDDGVKDLKIKARLGPVVRSKSSESKKAADVKSGGAERGLDLRNKMTRSAYNKEDTLQIIVNPTTSPALKGSVASRLGKIVVKRHESNSDDDNGDGNVKGNVVGKGRIAISRHAKSLVNKQCQEAVLSVNAHGRRLRKSVSPDSRCFEVADEDEEDEEEEEEDADDDSGEEKLFGSISDRKTVSVTVHQEIDSKDDEEVNDDDNGKGKSGNEGEYEDREPEDLAEMIGEKLEPELLNDTVQDELNLDLEEEVNAEDEDDIEKMIGVKSEEDKPKPGTRFIVTLDGVDERQLYSEGSGSGDKNVETPSFIQPQQAMVADPLQKLSPSATPYIPPPPASHQQMAPPIGIPVRANVGPSANISPGVPPSPFPPVNFNIADPLSLPPPIGTGIIRGEPQTNKPLPPKIQPFSINLKDSDDEFEDKESRMQISPSVSGSYISEASLTTLTALQKAKLSERCKYWPACAAGAECEFHHPTSYCKTFPNCKFADKCLFIHPNCKFDSKCTRQDCPFTHISRRPGLSSLASSAAPTIPFHAPKLPPPIPSRPSTTTICRFFPNCHNPACVFLHPKPCRFGAACQNPSCLFYHPAPAVVIPSKDKLKWKAQSLTATQLKDIPSSASSSSLPTPDPAAKFRQPVAKVSPMSSSSS